MFEGILYEGDENEWGNLRAAVGADIDLCLYGYVGGKTDTHQFDVVADEIHLFAQCDVILLIVVEHMAQQAAQFLDGNLCLVAVESDEGIYVVEGIEQEMRIQLVAQVLQLCFRTTFFGFTAGTFYFCPTAAHADGDSQADREDHGKHVAKDKYPAGRSGTFRSCGLEIRMEDEVLPKVYPDGGTEDEQQVQEYVLLDTPLEQETGDKETIVDIEYDEEEDRDLGSCIIMLQK